jgi:hypothetical protein
MDVVVCGSGVAAACCARLLATAGIGVTAKGTDRVNVPALMVSGRTQQLLRDVFQREDLFQGLPRVNARIVAWGEGSEPRRFEHSAVVVSERELLERLNWDGPRQEQALEHTPVWTVFASRPLPEPAAVYRFGARVASVFAVDLVETSEPCTCWIESLAGGWLFLLPGSVGKGWLLAVGGGHGPLLGESRLVARQIQSLADAGEFPAYPAMSVPFCGPQWLACGSAALAFDPLCGDGTGNAIREAILAAAVIRAAERSCPPEQLLEHYRARLLAGFAQHVQLCRDFYATGHRGPWWDGELELIDQGLQYCNREIEKTGPFRFRLQGFELRAV